MNTNTQYSTRFPTPAAEVLRQLEISRQEAEKTETRFMLCPICHFKVSKIPVTQTDIVYVKCQKCKFEGPLSPAFFRRMKRYHSRLPLAYRKQIR